MIKKQLTDCRSFFLDSGIIIDLLKTDLSACSPDIIKRISLINTFFKSLNDPQLLGGINKTIQISAISIAEIFHVDGHHSDTLAAIVELFDSQEVEIYSFDESTALFHNKEFSNILSNKELSEIKNSIAYPIALHSNIKDRLRKDIMIAATAKMYGSDIVLTNDSGFKTLCDKLGLSCYCFTESDAGLHVSQNGNLIYGFS